jgi:hypothetical protein
MAEPVAAGHGRLDEAERALRHVEPGRFVQLNTGMDQGGDHQPVPVGQHLVVEAGADPARTHRQQFVTQRGEARFDRFVLRAATQAIENRVTFEIALAGDVVVDGEEQRVVGAELADDLVVRPHIELSLLAFGVGVQGGAEGAVVGGHFAT